MLNNSPDTFCTHEGFIFLIAHWLYLEKGKRNKNVCGHTITFLQKEFYRFQSTGLKYYITTSNDTERGKKALAHLFLNFVLCSLISSHIVPMPSESHCFVVVFFNVLFLLLKTYVCTYVQLH